MARARKKTGTPQTYPNGMTKKQMKPKKSAKQTKPNRR